MRILVTGGNGFVGRELVKELERLGHSVEGFDFADGKNILDLAAVKQAVKGKQAVFHLAAVLDETKPREMLEVNVKGTENAIEAAAKAGVEHFVFLSTVGVHGNIHGRIDESAGINPETMYEASKARAETIVWESQEMLPVTIVRSALVLGANDYWKGIVKLVRKRFPIIGSGKNHFQTVYLTDLVSALCFVLGKEGCFGETYIVAGEDAPSLEELYAQIQKQLGIKKKAGKIPVWLGKLLACLFVFKSKLTGKKTVLLPQHVQRLVRERCYDTAKINALGWKASYGVEKAIEETVKELQKKGMI